MGKVTIVGIFSTIYTDPETQDCLQKEITLKGEAGKQIILEGLSLSLQVTKAGIKGTAWITANDKKVAEWTETKTTYQEKSGALNLVLGDGENLVLKWFIKTSNKSYRARMTDLTYTYSLADVEESDEPIKEPDEPKEVLIVTKCLESQTTEILGKLEGFNVEIFKQSS